MLGVGVALPLHPTVQWSANVLSLSFRSWTHPRIEAGDLLSGDTRRDTHNDAPPPASGPTK